jgi:hypothetical protein
LKDLLLYKARLCKFLKRKTFAEKSEIWVYFREAEGIVAHYQFIHDTGLPPYTRGDMDGPEGTNGVTMRQADRLFRGSSDLMLAPGHEKVFISSYPILYFFFEGFLLILLCASMVAQIDTKLALPLRLLESLP